MPFNILRTFVLLCAYAGSSYAYFVTRILVNGESCSSCVRQAVQSGPIVNLTSSDMACNSVRQNGSSKCKIKPDDEIAFEWKFNATLKEIEDITPNDRHKGPCAVYMKKVDDALTGVGAGDGWFKVSEDTVDSNGIFCSTRLLKAHAPQPGVVPRDIPPGDYLLRAEIITLNNAAPASIGGAEQPQFWIGCVQATVSNTSGPAPNSVVKIPGYVNISTPGLVYDIWDYDTYSYYPQIGPAPLMSTPPFESNNTTSSSTTSDARFPAGTLAHHPIIPSEADGVPTLTSIVQAATDATYRTATLSTAPNKFSTTAYPTAIQTSLRIMTPSFNTVSLIRSKSTYMGSTTWASSWSTFWSAPTTFPTDISVNPSNTSLLPTHTESTAYVSMASGPGYTSWYTFSAPTIISVSTAVSEIPSPTDFYKTASASMESVSSVYTSSASCQNSSPTSTYTNAWTSSWMTSSTQVWPKSTDILTNPSNNELFPSHSEPIPWVSVVSGSDYTSWYTYNASGGATTWAATTDLNPELTEFPTAGSISPQATGSPSLTPHSSSLATYVPSTLIPITNTISTNKNSALGQKITLEIITLYTTAPCTTTFTNVPTNTANMAYERRMRRRMGRRL